MEPRITSKYDAFKYCLDLELKSEIGDKLDLKAGEEFADGQATMGLRSLFNAYSSGMSTLGENLMKLEGFAEKVVKNDASN